jgi:serine/threonine-protein kinase
VVHRDIKPENILLHDGSAMVADFGIALAVSRSDGGTRMTETGMSLGTPHYMSPEQAMGEREITARSDIYALGCVTYEMLTGDPPFTGSTAQAIVARVFTEAPRPLTIQRHTIPPHVEAAVLIALEKLPADRFASAAAFAAALEGRAEAQPVSRSAAPTLTPVRRPAVRLLAGTGLLAFLVGAGVTALWLQSRPKEAPGIHASLVPPPGCEYTELDFGPPQLTPDGTGLTFLASWAGNAHRWHLTTGKLERLEGTVGASFPFWSPDGASLGFFSDGKLKRIDLGAMAVRNVAPAPAGRGGSWSTQAVIVFAPDIFSPLMRVDAAGGTPEPATALSDSGGRLTHRNPYFLLDGASLTKAGLKVEPNAARRFWHHREPAGRMGSNGLRAAVC